MSRKRGFRKLSYKLKIIKSGGVNPLNNIVNRIGTLKHSTTIPVQTVQKDAFYKACVAIIMDCPHDYMKSKALSFIRKARDKNTEKIWAIILLNDIHKQQWFGPGSHVPRLLLYDIVGPNYISPVQTKPNKKDRNNGKVI